MPKKEKAPAVDVVLHCPGTGQVAVLLLGEAAVRSKRDPHQWLKEAYGATIDDFGSQMRATARDARLIRDFLEENSEVHVELEQVREDGTTSWVAPCSRHPKKRPRTVAIPGVMTGIPRPARPAAARRAKRSS